MIMFNEKRMTRLVARRRPGRRRLERPLGTNQTDWRAVSTQTGHQMEFPLLVQCRRLLS